MKVDRPRLRSAHKRLRRIQFDRSEAIDVAMAPQEMLDFLATLAGLKPVCLVGRGFDAAGWRSGVEALAREMGLHVFVGPKWYAQPKHAGLPDWFAEIVPGGEIDGSALYVCKSGHVARQVIAICSAEGTPTMEEEARLLGYPICCVRDHYRRARMRDDAFLLMLSRAANGNEDEMRRLVREDVELAAETQQEEALFMEAARVRPAPYTSILMCRSCAVDPHGPAMRLSREYEGLVRAIDPFLASEIEMLPDALSAQGSP